MIRPGRPAEYEPAGEPAPDAGPCSRNVRKEPRLSAANTCGSSRCIWVNRLGQPWSRSSGIAFEAAAADASFVERAAVDVDGEMVELVELALLGPPVKAVGLVGVQLAQVGNAHAVVPAGAVDLVDPPQRQCVARRIGHNVAVDIEHDRTVGSREQTEVRQVPRRRTAARPARCGTSPPDRRPSAARRRDTTRSRSWPYRVPHGYQLLHSRGLLTFQQRHRISPVRRRLPRRELLVRGLGAAMRPFCWRSSMLGCATGFFAER